MANYPTVAEIAQVSGNPMLQGVVNAVIDDAPIFNSFYATELEGDRILTLGIVALPDGQFLNIGEGYSNGHTDTALVEYNAARIGGSVEVQESPMLKWNQAKSNAIKKGMVPDYFSLQAQGRYSGQILHVDQQIITGVSNDAKGFPGLKALTPYVSGNVLALTDTAQDSGWTKSVVNAGGATNNVNSSVYAVRFGDLDCSLCIGGAGGLAGFLNLPAPERQWLRFTDPVDGLVKADWFHVAAAEGYIGLSVQGGNEADASRKFPQRSVRRLANLTPLVPLTDTMLQKLVHSFPSNRRPNVLYMSYRSRDQLQDARSTGMTFSMSPGDAQNGTYKPKAPVPTHYEEIPIICSQSISNTDATES